MLLIYYRQFDDGEKFLELDHLDNIEPIQKFISSYSIPVVKSFDQRFTNIIFDETKFTWFLFLENGEDVTKKIAYKNLVSYAMPNQKKYNYFYVDCQSTYG